MQLLSDFFQTLPHFCLFTTLHPLIVHIPVTFIPFSLFLFIFSIVLKKNDLRLDKVDGMNFNLIKNKWSIGKDKSVNYIAEFIKN